MLKQVVHKLFREKTEGPLFERVISTQNKRSSRKTKKANDGETWRDGS